MTSSNEYNKAKNRIVMIISIKVGKLVQIISNKVKYVNFSELG
jgi:hypothetical protein